MIKKNISLFFVKSQIIDNRICKKDDSIADERLLMVCQALNNEYSQTSPAKFIDLHAPAVFAKPIEPPAVENSENVIDWCFNSITLTQFNDTQSHVQADTAKRKDYLESAFTQVIVDLTAEIQELQGKVLLGDYRVQDKILKKQERINELINKKNKRLENLELMMQLAPKAPEVLGCAYVVPLVKLNMKVITE